MNKKQSIVEYCKQGKSLSEITNLASCSIFYAKAILGRARKEGLLPPVATARNYLPEILTLIREGLSQQAIADRLNCAKNTVFRVIKEGRAKGQVPLDVIHLLQSRERSKGKGSTKKALISKESIARKLASLRELEQEDRVITLRSVRPPKPKVEITDELRALIIRMANQLHYNAQAIHDETKAEIEDIMQILRDDRLERMLAA